MTYLSIGGFFFHPGHPFPSSPPPHRNAAWAPKPRCFKEMPRSCWGIPPRRSKASLIPSWQRWSSVLRISMRRSPGGGFPVEPWEICSRRDIQGGCAVQFSGFSLVIHGMSNVSPNYSFCSVLCHLWWLSYAFLGFCKLSFWRFGTYWCSLFSRGLWLCETTVQQTQNHQDLCYSSTVFSSQCLFPLTIQYHFQWVDGNICWLHPCIWG